MSAGAAAPGGGRGSGAPTPRSSGLSAQLATAIRNSFRSPIVEAEAAEIKGMRKEYLTALRTLKAALRRLLELSQSGGDDAPEESDVVFDGAGAEKEGGRASLVVTELQRMAAHDSAIAGMTLSAETMINSIQSILEQIQRHKASVALGSGNETTDTVQRRREAALAPQRRLDQQVDQLLRAAGPAGM